MIERLHRAVESAHPDFNGEWFLTREWQRIDVFAVQCWSPWSRIAYELKTSRSDWLQELANPAKRELAWQIADELWFVCSSGIARPAEVPTGCGLVEVARDGSATVAVKAERHESRELHRYETADLLRRKLNPFDRQREQRELRILRRVVADRGIQVARIAELV